MTLDENRRQYIGIDPRAKIMLLLAASGLLVGVIPLWAELFIFIMAMIFYLNYGYVKSVIKYVGLFVLLYVARSFFIELPANGFTMFLVLMLQVVRSFLPSIAIGTMFVRTTTISEIMAATQRMKLPYELAIPFAVIIRFFPTLKEEWESIRMAMKMRGIGISLEYVMVPLLNSALIISDELSAASLSRGLGACKKRSNVCNVKLSMIDILICILSLVLLVYLYMI